MLLIEWDESLSKGIKEIDDQHKRWIDIINKLNSSIKEGKVRESVESILKSMVEYTHTHFVTEEKYFDKFGFDGAEEHKKEHKAFVEKVASFKKDIEAFSKDFEKGNVYMIDEVMNFIKSWIIGHIKATDQKYVECFKENGL